MIFDREIKRKMIEAFTNARQYNSISALRIARLDNTDKNFMVFNTNLSELSILKFHEETDIKKVNLACQGDTYAKENEKFAEKFFSIVLNKDEANEICELCNTVDRFKKEKVVEFLNSLK